MGDRRRCRSGRAGCGNPVYLHPLHRGPAACPARPARRLTCRIRPYPAGDLTLHGHTRKVAFTVSAKRTGGSITISGSIPVKFADWSIPNPSFGSFVTTQNHGSLEFLLTFART